MSYRPICDTWLLARPKPKSKYYGAYPNGFLERARVLLGAGINDPVLHLFGGRAADYPNKRRGFGPNDMCADAIYEAKGVGTFQWVWPEPIPEWWDAYAPSDKWRAILADPPYTPEDAKHYPGAPFPSIILIYRKVKMEPDAPLLARVEDHG